MEWVDVVGHSWRWDGEMGQAESNQAIMQSCSRAAVQPPQAIPPIPPFSHSAIQPQKGAGRSHEPLVTRCGGGRRVQEMWLKPINALDGPRIPPCGFPIRAKPGAKARE
jgi:hypothetical protein